MHLPPPPPPAKPPSSTSHPSSEEQSWQLVPLSPASHTLACGCSSQAHDSEGGGGGHAAGGGDGCGSREDCGGEDGAGTTSTSRVAGNGMLSTGSCRASLATVADQLFKIPTMDSCCASDAASMTAITATLPPEIKTRRTALSLTPSARAMFLRKRSSSNSLTSPPSKSEAVIVYRKEAPGTRGGLEGKANWGGGGLGESGWADIDGSAGGGTGYGDASSGLTGGFIGGAKSMGERSG